MESLGYFTLRLLAKFKVYVWKRYGGLSDRNRTRHRKFSTGEYVNGNEPETTTYRVESSLVFNSSR